jgi:putative ABC transport system ATP-binding protein
MELLREVGRSPDRCVIVVTHDSRIFRFGDRMANLTDGRIMSIERIRQKETA